MDRAAAENDFAPAKFNLSMRGDRANSDTTVIFKDETAHLGLREDDQIGSLPDRGAQVGDRRRYATLVDVGDRNRIIAVVEHPVLVRDIAMACELERFGH